MKVLTEYEQGSEEWQEARRGKITGTRLADIYSARAWTKEDLVATLEAAKVDFKKSANKAALEELLTDEMRIKLLANAPRKKGFYETIAERLSIPRDEEDRMERGLRLEFEARERFEAETGKKITQVGICQSDRHPAIINSPDGLIANKDGIYTEAIEIKCLNSASHIQAVVEQAVPEEYWGQKNQYFVVNEALETLYFVFFDPSIASVPYYVVEITRESLGEWPQRLLEFQLAQLAEMDKIVEMLAF